jgi:conjugal transfer ATP-binding protein TraC
MLSQLGAKIAKAFGEEDSGIPLNSYFENVLESYGRQYMISDLLHYDGYDEKTQTFFNQDNTGFVLETLPLIGASEEMQKEVSSLFQYVLPEGSSLQVILWADPHIGDICDSWKQARLGQARLSKTSNKQSPIFEKLAERRSAFLKDMAFDSPHSPYTLRNFRCFLSYSQPHMGNNPLAREEIAQILNQIKTSLEMLRLPVTVWRPEDLINTLEGILCLDANLTVSRKRSWNPLESLQSQITSAESSLLVKLNNLVLYQEGTKKPIKVKTYKIRSYPEVWSLHAMGRLIGDNERDMAQIPCPFIIHYGIHVPKQDDLQKKVTSKALYVNTQAQSPLTKYLPSLQREASELEFVRQQLDKGERIVKTHFSIILFAPDNILPKADQILRNLFQGQEWRLESNLFLHLPMFLSALPMSWGPAMIKTLANLKKLKTTLSTESSNLLPLQGEWHGTPSKAMILAGRRGQLFTWSPFDSGTNFNTIVLGQTGAGKSVLMQEIALSLLGLGHRVIILDFGRSYQKIGQLLGAQFIRITNQFKFSLNPFSDLVMGEDHDQDYRNHLTMIKQIVISMLSPSGALNDLENSYLEMALDIVTSQKGADAEISDVAAWFLNHDDPRVNDMGTRLYSFTKDGIYGKFFAGKSTISFTSHFIIVEFEDIKDNKELSAVLFQTLVVNISNIVYRGDRKTKGALIMDECPEFIKEKPGEVLVDGSSRKFRKYGWLLILGSQNAEDFLNSLGAKAAFNNSAWKFYLSQSNEAYKVFEKEGLINSPSMLSLLRTIKMNPGKYGEALIVSDSGYAVGRLILDPFSQLLYSTKAEEFTAIETMVNQGIPVDEAIDQLLERKSG